eukprot:SAG22_NODE_1984_length_3206_cov_2.186675_3_plen_108_part_00
MQLCVNVGTREICAEVDYPTGDLIVKLLIQFFWCFLWNWVGHWAMETRNKIWTGVVSAQCALFVPWQVVAETKPPGGTESLTALGFCACLSTRSICSGSSFGTSFWL